MKTFLSLKPEATFFLGSSRTLIYHKEDVEFVYRMKVGNKPIYAHVYVALSGERSVMVYADWGDYFHHLSSITDKEHFMKIMKRPEISSHCPLKLWKDRLMAVWGEETK